MGQKVRHDSKEEEGGTGKSVGRKFMLWQYYPTVVSSQEVDLRSHEIAACLVVSFLCSCHEVKRSS